MKNLKRILLLIALIFFASKILFLDFDASKPSEKTIVVAHK